MPGLSPGVTIGDAVQNTGGVHVSCSGGVDGFDLHAFDGNEIAIVHEDRAAGSQGEGHIFGMFVDLVSTIDGVFFFGQAFGFFFVTEEEIDGAFDELQKFVAEQADQKRIGNGKRDFDVVLFWRVQSFCRRRLWCCRR